MSSPTGLIPWFSKTKGNTYATLLYHPFLFKGKSTQCSRGIKKDFWRRCRGGSRKTSQDLTPDNESRRCRCKSRHTEYPSQTLIPRITLFAICLSFSSPPLRPCRVIHLFFFRSPSLFLFAFLAVSCLLVCWIACLS